MTGPIFQSPSFQKTTRQSSQLSRCKLSRQSLQINLQHLGIVRTRIESLFIPRHGLFLTHSSERRTMEKLPTFLRQVYQLIKRSTILNHRDRFSWRYLSLWPSGYVEMALLRCHPEQRCIIRYTHRSHLRISRGGFGSSGLMAIGPHHKFAYAFQSALPTQFQGSCYGHSGNSRNET